MINGTRFTAMIVAVERLDSSTNGNPRFKITFDDGQIRSTAVDASVGYAVDNYRVGDLVVVTLNGRRSIVDLDPAKA